METTSVKPKNSFVSLFYQRYFRLHLIGFIVFNIFIYLWISVAHGLVPFNRFNYTTNAHHYVTDSRLSNPTSFNLIRGLGQYDAQWYLKIADTGYPNHPPTSELNNKKSLGSLSYAFAPVYPLLIATVNSIVNSIEVSAFIVTQVVMILSFSLIFWLVTRWYNQDLAAKTAWLVFLNPFSIFYRSYFAEGLFLVLLIIFMDSIRSQKWFKAALAASWLAITRFVGIITIPILFFTLFTEYRKKQLQLSKLLKLAIITILPLLFFITFCGIKTGHPFYFMSVRSAWFSGLPPPPLATFWLAWHFFSLPWHHFHLSRIDLLSIFISGVLVYLSRKWLPRPWWYLALLLWLFPILTTDTMSASRYQIVNLPLFLYVAHVLSTRWYRALIAVSAIGLLVVSILFINWVWIG